MEDLLPRLLVRRQLGTVLEALTRQPAVVMLGPRQAGKTTLAFEVAKSRPSVYLDLEAPADRAKLFDPTLFFEAHWAVPLDHCRVVYSGTERYSLGEGIEAIGLPDLAAEVSGL